MRRGLFTFLALIMCLVCISMPVFAGNEDLDAQYNAIADKLASLKTEIETTQTTINGISKAMAEADASIAEINTQLAALDTNIAALDSRMAETQAQIAELEAQKAQQEAELEERLRVMYMYGNDGYVQMLFSAENLTDLLTRVDLMKNVMTADRGAVTALEETQKQLHDSIASVEADKASVEQAKKAQSDAKAIQESLKAQQAELLAKNQSLIDDMKAEYAAEITAGNEIAAALGKEPFNGVVQSGEFYWPFDISLDRAFYISSPFGYRTDGYSTYHEGIDITPGDGTPIMAIADGTVSSAGVNGGYGNCVVLNNGQDSSGQSIGSIYGHMSRIATSTGATVKKGDVIGYVGSTGWSTGAHLHMSILVNGTQVDPIQFYPQYQANFKYVD